MVTGPAVMQKLPFTYPVMVERPLPVLIFTCPRRDGQAELTWWWVRLRWISMTGICTPVAVIHPSTNGAQCRTTTWMSSMLFLLCQVTTDHNDEKHSISNARDRHAGKVYQKLVSVWSLEVCHQHKWDILSPWLYAKVSNKQKSFSKVTKGLIFVY